MMARKTKVSTPASLPEQQIEYQAQIKLQDNLMIQTEEAGDYSPHSRSRCGGALRAEREKQGLSTQDIASKLRLSTKQIEAIEADNFSKLPEPTIVRGFIRNYAKQLKINAEPLLDAYTVIVPSNTPHELTIEPTSSMRVSSYDKPKTSSYMLAGAAALIVFAIWLFYQSYIEKPSPTKLSTNIDAAVDSLEPLPEPALPAAERLPAPEVSTELVLPPTEMQPIANQAEVVSPGATPFDNAVSAAKTPAITGAAPYALPSSSEGFASPLPTPSGMARLEFNATQETWVSVVNANGREIFNKTIFAGSRETLNVKPPIKVIVGNAGATSLSMDDKAVDLAPHSRNNVARINLD